MALAAAPVSTAWAAAPALVFPRDFGAHETARTEWWYITGSLQDGARLWGFQITFFRSSTGIAAAGDSRFAPTQLIFAHAALTDLEGKRLRHDQRIARGGFGIAQTQDADTGIALRDWRLVRVPQAADTALSLYNTRAASETEGFAFALDIRATQAPLLQGAGGISKKGPADDDISHYYSEPQLAVQGRLELDGKTIPVRGRAWLDHEWSDAFVPAGAVGWDWIGMNLDDGTALTLFRLRRADGSALFAGGSWRRPAQSVRSFGPQEVVMSPGRRWTSASSGASYPVEWRLQTPEGGFQVVALLDNQELDSRGSTGSIYWEGLSRLLDDTGRPIGRGYLEMTGYASTLRL